MLIVLLIKVANFDKLLELNSEWGIMKRKNGIFQSLIYLAF